MIFMSANASGVVKFIDDIQKVVKLGVFFKRYFFKILQ
ncbi:hypothetical protein BM1374165_00020 [Bartonella henselae]|uniref:Uncharacterized protein n=1 Tax=Bartonella henselae TaxID=38323 RepID=X5ME38_BARHN|nr:hypothetical protein BM1374165_00020 [Bartonella henselae]